ncbi:tetratricopeptide repeat-containing sensor histidine kinase [Tenacibaculum halocynthiae]|uniref:tetratricopeptide repeat-containing sensor histidine kinase n=1 Tax=Tenacibaculum halocynthiae TaxID=1254437 RepID=UPI00389330A0
MFSIKRYTVFFVFLHYGCFSQTGYIDDWFSNNCDYCVSLNAKQKKLDKDKITWHKAHIAFENKDYKKANYYLLSDKHSFIEKKHILQGHIFLRLGVYDKVKKYFNDSILKKNEKYNLLILKSLADFYEKKNKDSAIVYYKKILKYNTIPYKLENEVHESLAYINLSKRQFGKAEISYKILLKKCKKNNDSLFLARIFSSLGNLYFEQYQDKKAKKYFDTAYTVVKPLKNLRIKSNISHNLYIVSEALKEHKQAIKYLKEYNVFQDSIQKENTIWQVAQQKEVFNIEKKQVEIDKRTAQRNVFIVLAIATLLLLVVIYFFYKKLQQKHQQIGVLNEELKEVNALKNQIFSIVAHDLRSPVALLKQKFQVYEPKENKETITINKDVVSVIDSLSFLLDNLLNWSLSQSNLLFVQKDWFPLLPVVKQIEHQYQSLLQEKKIEFTSKDLNSVLIFGDMELFKIVLRNCLDNAIKFTPIGGTIMISGVVESEFFKLRIQDSGVGIPETVLKTLFELDAQKAQKDTEGRKSSGLGLHLVKSMIELNDGMISIENNPQGGTIVNISILHKIIA